MLRKALKNRLKIKRKSPEALSFDALVYEIKKFKLRGIDLKLLKKAFEFSRKAHEGQKRRSGEPYFIHPYSICKTLISYKLDTPTLTASLLHDVVEDTRITPGEIKRQFGREIARLVRGISKLKKLSNQGMRGEVENLRKMFLAMAKDIRVVLIKLADRLHNMETLEYQTAEKQRIKAQEALEIYAPIADRLGMGDMKGKLEDLAFPYVYPKEYKIAKSLYNRKIYIKKRCIRRVKTDIERTLEKEKIRAYDIHGRVKHIYSFYLKLNRYNNDLNQIFDLVALRIIVENISDCYAALGAIHKKWKPLPGRIKDYISTPKANGYQSLHTTVSGPDGEIVEIQIRTPQMHEEAERGIAAHWDYKARSIWPFQKRKKQMPKIEREWVKQLSEWQKNIGNPDEFLETLKIDFFKNRIFVLTPTGEVIDLPDNSTPVDFAYQIHSDIGHSCVSAKVNGKITKLDSRLQSGDTVEIIISKTPRGPKRDWLDFTQTDLAKNKIRGWFRNVNRDQNIKIGKKLFSETLRDIHGTTIEELRPERVERGLKKLPYTDFEDLLAGIGQGDLSSTKAVNAFYRDEEILSQVDRPQIKFSEGAKIKVAGQSGILVSMANCCNPSPGDEIIGYISEGGGIRGHKKNCINLKTRLKNENKLIAAHWENKNSDSELYPVPITIEAWDRVGLLADVCTRLADLGILIRTVTAEPHGDGSGHIHMILDVKNTSELLGAVSKLKKIEGVYRVKRN